MNIQEKVAARRAELARQDAQLKAEVDNQAAQRKEAEIAQLHDSLNTIASELSTDNVHIDREGDSLKIVKPGNLVSLDLDSLKRRKVVSLIESEARRMWTPGENWLSIGFISAGVPALTVPLLGILMIVLGLGLGYTFNMKYIRAIQLRHPELARFKVKA